MKTLRMLTLRLSLMERTVFWVCLAVVVFVYFLGTAVHVPWGNAPIPVSEVLGTLRLNSPFDQDVRRWLIALGGAVLLGLRYTTMASWKFRVLLLGSGLLLSVLIISELVGRFSNAVALIGYAPLLVFQAVFGLADGEFYGEGMPKFAAAGLWMLLSVVFLIREFVRGARNGVLAQQGGCSA